jgi:hypothetical protein
MFVLIKKVLHLCVFIDNIFEASVILILLTFSYIKVDLRAIHPQSGELWLLLGFLCQRHFGTYSILQKLHSHLPQVNHY